MTITIEHLYRARLPENPEVNYAGHPSTYDFLIIIKTTNYKCKYILPLNILLDSTKS